MTTHPVTSSRADARLQTTSINGKMYTADNERDAEFLRLTARFFETADRISKDPRKRRPKLRWI